MAAVILFSVGFFIMTCLLAVCLFLLVHLKSSLLKTKTKLSENTIAMRVIYKNIQSLEGKIQSQSSLLNQIDEQRAQNPDPKNNIEQEYARARQILKSGADEDISHLHSCDMTQEEIELLTDLMKSNEFNH